MTLYLNVNTVPHSLHDWSETSASANISIKHSLYLAFLKRRLLLHCSAIKKSNPYDLYCNQPHFAQIRAGVGG